MSNRVKVKHNSPMPIPET